MTTESMSYKELAARMGVKLESARRTVARKRWTKTTANDGSVRIIVPIEALIRPPSHNDSHNDSPSVSPSDSPNDSHHDAPEAPPAADPLPAVNVQVLEAEIGGLRALVESEKARADAAERDRDAWRAQATRSLFSRIFG